jgi:uncharacterized protein (DUF1810 family)
MTLFAEVSPEPVCGDAIAKYYCGKRDPATLGILAKFGA